MESWRYYSIIYPLLMIVIASLIYENFHLYVSNIKMDVIYILFCSIVMIFGWQGKEVDGLCTQMQSVEASLKENQDAPLLYITN